MLCDLIYQCYLRFYGYSTLILFSSITTATTSLFDPSHPKPHLIIPMANTITNLSSQSPYASPSTLPKSTFTHSLHFFLCTKSSTPLTIPKLLKTTRTHISASAASSSASSSTQKPAEKLNDERVKKIHSTTEFDEALRTAKDKLVVVEYAASHSHHSQKIYPFMVELSRTCNDTVFLLVMGDESESTRVLCKREKVEKVPHFSFYKGNEKVHEEEGIGPDQLYGDVLYYGGGDANSAVAQLHGAADVEKLIEDHKNDGKLIVLDVGLKHCGPCVKVYPTVVKLSRQMKDTVAFARINGDENESTMKFLKTMDVVEVPTFLFIRNGDVCGRYVGSGKGELIGEILRYQGVRVTY